MKPWEIAAQRAGQGAPKPKMKPWEIAAQRAEQARRPTLEQGPPEQRVDALDSALDDVVGAGADLAAEKKAAIKKDDSFFKNTIDVAAELAAGVNRSATKAVDFFGPDTANAFLEIAGSDARVPTLTGALEETGIEGGFMDEGLARDLAQSAGETAGFAFGAGALARNVASRLPTATSADSVATGVMRQMGGSTAKADASMGAASGVGGEIGEEVAGAEGKMIGGLIAPVAAAGISAPARSIAGFGKSAIPRKQADLINAANESEIPLMTSDIRTPGTFIGKTLQQTAEKIPILGTGPARQNQQVMRSEAVDKVVRKYGEYSYEAIIGSLKSQRDKHKNAAGRVLESVGVKLDAFGAIETPATTKAILKAREALNKPNVIKSSDAEDDLKALVDAIDQVQDFTSLKENRTAFRDIVNSTDGVGRSQLTSRAKSLLQNVQKAMTEDMDSFAKANLQDGQFGKWKIANITYAREARNLTKTKLKNVLDKGDVTPESVRTMLFSQAPSEQLLLYKSLGPAGRSHARAAIISKVVDDASKRMGGVSPNSFVTGMRKLRPQVDIFFKGKEKVKVVGLMRVLDATRRAQDAAVATATGQQMIGLATGASLAINSAATLSTGGSLGLLAQAYESAIVRNALLRLGSVPVAHRDYSQALLNAQIALQLAGQAEQQQQDKPAPQ